MTNETEKTYKNRYGTLKVVTLKNKRGESELLPLSYKCNDNSAMFTKKEGTPIIKYMTKKGKLSLTPWGFQLRSSTNMHPYTKKNIRKFVEALRTDEQFQESIFKLRQGMVSSFFEYSANNKFVPAGSFSNVISDLATKNYVPVLAGNIISKKNRYYDCTIEEQVTTITEEIYDWVDTTKKALDQAVECELNCIENNNTLEAAICGVECAKRTWHDITTRSWEVVNTLTREVVEYKENCVAIEQDFVVPPIVSGIGRIRIDLLKPVTETLECLLNGEWKLTKVNDMKFDITDVELSGVGEIPLAITVCMDRKCQEKLKNHLGTLGLSNAITVLGGEAGLIALIQKEGLKAGAVALAGILGISIAELYAILLVMLVLIAYHSLAIAGQIVILDNLKKVPKGICLNHPTFPIITTGAINLALMAWLIIHVPIIVIPRE